jgi:glucose dehydrogenase
MTVATPDFPKPKGLAVVIGLTAILLLLLGAQLTFFGGSPYYMLSGLTLAMCSLLLFKGDPRGAWLYGIFLIITYLWSFYESWPRRLGSNA